MQIEEMDEVVSVRADFAGGEVTPRAFRRSGRSYRVTAVNARWLDREGAHPVHHFSVQAEGDTYFLRLETGEMLWKIEKVVLEG
jgi:hypothetical protein